MSTVASHSDFSPHPAPGPEIVTLEDRTYATLAHALQVVCGLIATLVIFLIRDKSKFVRFHALQALLLQLVFLVLYTVLALLGFITMFAWFVAMGLWVTLLVVAMLFAIRTWRGEWAEYPVIGHWVRRFLHV